MVMANNGLVTIIKWYKGIGVWHKKIDKNWKLKYITLRSWNSIICLPRIFVDNKEESYWLISNLKSEESKWRRKAPSNMTSLNHFDLECPEEALLLLLSWRLIAFDRNLSVWTRMSMILRSHKNIREDCGLKGAPHKNVQIDGKRQWKRDCIYSISTRWVMIPTGNISSPGFRIPMN